MEGSANHDLSDNALSDNALSWHIILRLAYRCKATQNCQTLNHQGKSGLRYVVEALARCRQNIFVIEYQ